MSGSTGSGGEQEAKISVVLSNLSSSLSTTLPQYPGEA